MGLFRAIAEHFGWVKPLVLPVVGEIWVEKNGAYGPPRRVIIKSVGTVGVYFNDEPAPQEKGPDAPPPSPGGIECMAPHSYFQSIFRRA